MTGYAALGLRGKPEKEDPDPLVADSNPLIASSVRVFVQGTRNERVGVYHKRVWVLFFSGMWVSVWGSPCRLHVPYVIPRLGVPHHMYIPICFSNKLYFVIYIYLRNYTPNFACYNKKNV